MYKLANVERFLADMGDEVDPGVRDMILDRAKRAAETDGLIMAGQSAYIWEDSELGDAFAISLGGNIDQLKILFDAACAA
jgi:hypothetical protein